jgi:D-psicose/D-tagatose/L-ribulose 3-epimerase
MRNEIEESQWMPAIGVNSMTYTRPFTSEHYPLFRRMKAAGMNFCELLVPEEGELDAADAGQAARDAGLSLVFAARINPHRDLAAEDHAVRRSGVEYLRRCVDIAVAAGAKIVGGPTYGSPLVFAGRVPEPIDESDRLARIQRVVAGLKEAGDYAVQQGVEFAIEPLNRFETDFCNTARQAVELVTQVGNPAVNVMLDTFHMNMEEDDLGRAIRRAAAYLVHFQANENHRGYLGTGHLNWAEICHVLAEIDYRGPITLEPFRRTETMLSLPLAQWRSPSYDEDLDLHHSAAFLRAALHAARRII